MKRCMNGIIRAYFFGLQFVSKPYKKSIFKTKVA